MKKSNAKLLAADVAECALFVALMVVGAFVRIQLPFMALTFQTVFAILAGLLLGWKKGMIAISTYAIMGLVGIPVFSNGGGIAYILQPSFGYILGFIASAGIAGLSFSKFTKPWQVVIFSLLAFVADYVFGIAYFAVVWAVVGRVGLGEAVISNLMFMPKDLALTLLAAFLAIAVAPRIRKLHARGKKASVQIKADVSNIK